jgi:hypothetical protein
VTLSGFANSYTTGPVPTFDQILAQRAATTYAGNSVQRKTFRFPLGARVAVTSRVQGTESAVARVVGHVKSYSHDPYVVKLEDGSPIHAREDDLRRLPEVGLGATMHYVSDSVALVITRVTPRTVVTHEVRTEDPVRDMASDAGAWGVRPTNARGILDQPIPGTDRRWTLNKQGRYVSHGQYLTLGYSVSRRDWRD